MSARLLESRYVQADSGLISAVAHVQIMELWELNITQNDCPNVETTESHKNTCILIMNTEVVGNYQDIFSIIYSTETDELNSALQFLSAHRRISNFNLISKRKNIAMAFYRMVQTSMFRKTAKLGFRIHPILVGMGKEKWFYINSGEEPLTEEDVNDEFTTIISMDSIAQEEFFLQYPATFNRLNTAHMMTMLSGDEVRLINTINELGFFDWPRGASLTQLSRKMKMSKSTLSYHVRGVEKKIADMLTQDIKICQ